MADAAGNEANATRTVRVMPFISYDPSVLNANLANLSSSGVTDVFVQGPVGQDLNITYSPTIPSGLNVTFHSDQDLYILKPFSYAGEQTVTLSAGGSIFVQASITASHTHGKLAAHYGLYNQPGTSKALFIAPQSPAFKAGINVGDEIISINNISVEKDNINKWAEYFGGKLKITIKKSYY